MSPRNPYEPTPVYDDKPRTKFDWMDDALCAEIGGDLFFPTTRPAGGGKHSRGDYNTSRDARAICHDCPVRKQCADWGKSNHETSGLWGGKPRRDRHAALKLRREAERNGQEPPSAA